MEAKVIRLWIVWDMQGHFLGLSDGHYLVTARIAQGRDKVQLG